MIRPDGEKKAYVKLTADHDAMDTANKVCLFFFKFRIFHNLSNFIYLFLDQYLLNQYFFIDKFEVLNKENKNNNSNHVKKKIIFSHYFRIKIMIRLAYIVYYN